jgi:hypothetical protein
MAPRTKVALSFLTGAAVIGTAFAAPVAESGRKFVEALTGQAEIDAGAMSADMDGRGTAHVTVNVGQGRVCWNLVGLANLDPITAAHIHEAPSTAPGPIRISFFHFDEPVDLEGCTETPGTTTHPFDQARLRDILQNPENYYVNIHTTAFPPGAIRGQLGKNKNR